jgi:hypothetical protein
MRLPRVRFTVRRMLAGVAIAAIISYIGAGIWEAGRAGDRLSLQGGCYSSLNNIALAMSSYSEAHGRFPAPFVADAAGRRVHSWRAVISRLLPQGSPAPTESYDFHQRWDGPINARLAADVPGFLQCPSECVDNPHGSPFVMVNDFGDVPVNRLPRDAILVLEAWGANRNWLDPNDRVESTPRLRVAATDHPHGFGVILRDFRVVRVRDAGRIRKTGAYYVLDPE